MAHSPFNTRDYGNYLPYRTPLPQIATQAGPDGKTPYIYGSGQPITQCALQTDRFAPRTEGNAVAVFDNKGKIVSPSHHNRFGEKSFHTIVVDSRDRDRSKFPNANAFDIWLPTEYKNVYSVELQMVILPIPQAVGGEKYAALHISELALTRQAQEAAQFTPGNTNDSNSEAYWVIPLVPSFTGAALPTTLWRQGESRVIKRFFPVHGKLKKLHVELTLRGNGPAAIPYPFADDDPPPEPTDEDLNYMFVLEICSQK